MFKLSHNFLKNPGCNKISCVAFDYHVSSVLFYDIGYFAFRSLVECSVFSIRLLIFQFLDSS